MVNIYCIIDDKGRVIDRKYLTDSVANEMSLPEGFSIEKNQERHIEEVTSNSSLEIARKKIMFYQEMLSIISSENISLGLTAQQIASVVEKLSGVKAVAEVGMWEAAIYRLKQIQVDEIYSESRRQAHISIIYNFLSSL